VLGRFVEAETVLACTEFGSKECVQAQTEFDSEESHKLECYACCQAQMELGSEETQEMECWACRGQQDEGLEHHISEEWFQHRDLDEVHAQA
jgi:hypothetical protein